MQVLCDCGLMLVHLFACESHTNASDLLAGAGAACGSGDCGLRAVASACVAMAALGGYLPAGLMLTASGRAASPISCMVASSSSHTGAQGHSAFKYILGAL